MYMVYLDSAAATPLDPRVFDAMKPWLSSEYANPNATYQPAQRARAAIDDARMKVATFLHCKPTEIIFTGSGTESCNMAIRGVVENLILAHFVIPSDPERVRESKGSRGIPFLITPPSDSSTSPSSTTPHGFGRNDKSIHVITSAIEHSSILKPIEYLQKLLGIEVTVLPVSRDGIVSVEDFTKAIRSETKFASIMLVNNQIGTIHPIAEIGAICRERGIIFHTDACQGPGFLDLDVSRLNVDLLSLNASKIYGPKGVGVLYIREGTKIEPLIHGGSQEFKLRAGTENVAGIVGMGKAVEQLMKENHTKEALKNTFSRVNGDKLAQHFVAPANAGSTKCLRSASPKNSRKDIFQSFPDRIQKLRDQLWSELQQSINGIKLNGCLDHRIANNLNVCIPGIDAEMLVKKLDLEGICVATTAACVSGITEPSHVLKAIGLSDEEAKSSIRITLGKYTTEEEIARFISHLKKILKQH